MGILLKKKISDVYVPFKVILKLVLRKSFSLISIVLLTIGNALVYGYTSSAIVLGSIFLVWSGITLGVSMLGIVLGGFVNKLEVTFILENLGTILDAKPFAAILLAILLLGNLWVLTHYLEKDIRTSGAVIGSAYVLVWGVTCTCVVYNIFGYFGLLPVIGAFSVSLSRIAIGTGLFVYGHSGIFVRSFWTFTEDFRDGLILVWQGLRFRNWDRRTKYYFYNTVLLMAFFGLATTHQEVYLMASPDTWEDLFKVLKFQDVATKDQSWRDIPINQLIGDKGEIKISLQEATPEQVKRLLYYKLSESPEALAAAGYGIWHVVMGFIGGLGICLSVILLFKGGGGGPPPPPPPSGGGDAVVPKGNPLTSERGSTGEASTLALPIVAPGENKVPLEAKQATDNGSSSSSRERSRAMGLKWRLYYFFLEGYNNIKEDLREYGLLEPFEEKKVFPKFKEIGAIRAIDFYTPEEQELLVYSEVEREKVFLASCAAWPDIIGPRGIERPLLEEERVFILKFIAFAEIHRSKAEELLEDALAVKCYEIEYYIDDIYLDADLKKEASEKFMDIKDIERVYQSIIEMRKIWHIEKESFMHRYLAGNMQLFGLREGLRAFNLEERGVLGRIEHKIEAGKPDLRVFWICKYSLEARFGEKGKMKL